MNDNDKVNLFTDLFQNDSPLQKKRGWDLWYPKRWKMFSILRFLLLVFVGYILTIGIFQLNIERVCVEVVCEDAIGITSPEIITVKGTVDNPVTWRCTDIEFDPDPSYSHCGSYEPVGGKFIPGSHEVDGEAEWRECECNDSEWKINDKSAILEWLVK